MEIHIKNDGGEDTLYCGNVSNPCKSIEFTIRNISKVNEDVVYLHGGKSRNASVYNVQEAIVLKHHLRLTKHGDLNFGNPIIQPKYGSTSSTDVQYAFIVPNNSSSSVTVDSIDFLGIGIIYCNMSTECNVTLQNSKVLIQEKLFSSHLIYFHEFFTSHIFIRNSSLYWSTSFAINVNSGRTKTSLNITIDDSNLVNSKIDVQLTGTDSSFSGIFNELIATNSSSISISSTRVDFHVNDSLFCRNNGSSDSIHVPGQQDHHALLYLQSQSLLPQSSVSVFRITNVEFYNNKYYEKLVHISAAASTANQHSMVLENITIDFNELYGSDSILVSTETGATLIQNVSINARNKQVKSIFSMKETAFTINDVQAQLIYTDVFFHFTDTVNTGTISNIYFTDIGWITEALYAKYLTDTTVSNITFNNVRQANDDIITSLIVVRGATNVTIKNILIKQSNVYYLLVLREFKNSLVTNVTVQDSDVEYVLQVSRNSFGVNVNGFTIHDSVITDAVSFSGTPHHNTVRNISIRNCKIQSCFKLTKMYNSKVTSILIQNNTIGLHMVTAYRSRNLQLSNWTAIKNKLELEITIRCNPISLKIEDDICVEFIDWSFHQNKGVLSGFLLKRSYIYSQSAKPMRLIVRGFNASRNSIEKYMFEIEEKNKFTLTSAVITNNSYQTCVYVENTCTEINNVVIKGNRASGIVKEIHLTINQKSEKIIKHNCYNRTAVVLSTLNISSAETNPSVNSNDAVFFDFSINVSLIMHDVQLNILPYQTRALRILVSMLDYAVLTPDYLVTCPPGMFYTRHTEYLKLGLQIVSSCEICPKGTYGLYGYTKRVFNHTLLKTINSSLSENFKCKPCPYGGTCINGHSVSRGNFFGYETIGFNLRYIPCPLSYCCSMDTKKCSVKNACNFNRTGTLCGECIDDYQENIFQRKCSKSSECRRFYFWVFHIAAAASMLFFHCFIDCIGNVISLLKRTVQKCLGRFFGKRRSDHYNLKDITLDATSADNINSNNPRQSKDSSSSSQKTIELILFTKKSPERIDDNITCHGVECTTLEQLRNEENKFTISGIIQILISFYQIRSLINIDLSGTDDQQRFLAFKAFDNLINLKMPFLNFGETFCPFIGLDAVQKAFINNVMLSITMTVLLLVVYTLTNIQQSMTITKPLSTRNDGAASMPFRYRLEICYLRLMLFSYKNIATFCLLTLNCVPMEKTYVLYMKGTTKCMQSWQFVSIAFVVTWLVPFPFALSYSFKLYRRNNITFHMLLVSVTFPIVALVLFARRRLNRELCLSICHNNVVSQLNAMKLIFEEPYRPLNNGEPDKYIFWESFRICKSFLISVIVIFIIDPLWKNIISMPFMLFFLFIYVKVNPLKKNLVVLHWMEVVQSLALCYVVLVNFFKSFLYVFSIPDEGPVKSIMLFITYSELLSSPIIVLVAYFAFIPAYDKMRNLLKGEKVE